MWLDVAWTGDRSPRARRGLSERSLRHDLEGTGDRSLRARHQTFGTSLSDSEINAVGKLVWHLDDLAVDYYVLCVARRCPYCDSLSVCVSTKSGGLRRLH